MMVLQRAASMVRDLAADWVAELANQTDSPTEYVSVEELVVLTDTWRGKDWAALRAAKKVGRMVLCWAVSSVEKLDVR